MKQPRLHIQLPEPIFVIGRHQSVCSQLIHPQRRINRLLQTFLPFYKPGSEFSLICPILHCDNYTSPTPASLATASAGRAKSTWILPALPATSTNSLLPLSVCFTSTSSLSAWSITLSKNSSACPGPAPSSTTLPSGGQIAAPMHTPISTGPPEVSTDKSENRFPIRP